MDDIKIIFSDKAITVCEKPPLLLSQQDAKGSQNLIAALNSKENSDHKAVHRLDFGVGGTMVYAKTAQSAAKLSAEIADRSFNKEYLAVVYGRPENEQGVYKDLLFKDSSKNKSFVVDRMRKGVKEASLEYRVIDTKECEKGSFSLVWIKLHTGRTHQIRVQFASRKTPLYGDGKYGSRTNEKVTALWSYKLSFLHPTSKKEVAYTSLPAGYFPWNLFDLSVFQ